MYNYPSRGRSCFHKDDHNTMKGAAVFPLPHVKYLGAVSLVGTAPELYAHEPTL